MVEKLNAHLLRLAPIGRKSLFHSRLANEKKNKDATIIKKDCDESE